MCVIHTHTHTHTHPNTYIYIYIYILFYAIRVFHTHTHTHTHIHIGRQADRQTDTHTQGERKSVDLASCPSLCMCLVMLTQNYWRISVLRGVYVCQVFVRKWGQVAGCWTVNSVRVRVRARVCVCVWWNRYAQRHFTIAVLSFTRENISDLNTIKVSFTVNSQTSKCNKNAHSTVPTFWRQWNANQLS